jgi:uncharacterized protein YbbC (DUF1343 family)
MPSLSLNDRVSSHLPAFASEGKSAITVRQLLLHTSGLPIVNALSQYEDGPKLALERLLAIKLAHQPGDRYVYSDLGYIVLGALIEKISGKTLDVAAQQWLFTPLDLRDTLFGPSLALRPRIAPTEIADERTLPLIHGEVHDPRAYLLGGVAGNAGLFSTAHDVSQLARLLLNEGQLEGRRLLSRASVEAITRPQRVAGGFLRTAGWDMTSPYSRSRGARLSKRAFGHGGYTGTSVWVDPALDVFVVVLTNRVHPHAEQSVVRLQGAVADAIVDAIAPVPPRCSAAPSAVQTGIDQLAQRGFAPLAGRRVTLLTHRAAVNAQGVPTLDILASAPEVKLVSVMTPEHGLEANAEGAVADSRDPQTSLVVHSLYGKTQRPTARMLQDVDHIVVDLVDVGTRYYTYMSTLHQTLIAAAQYNIPVMILDRPNPIGGLKVEGPMLDSDRLNFVNYHPLPVRHGMTAGELATLVNEERHIGARIEVVEVSGWQRSMAHAQTGLPWRNPSPNLRSADAALLYPAIGLLESTNVSVGRGTDRPFHVLGAPFIDGNALARALGTAMLPGVTAEPVHFTPDANPHAGQQCHGISLTVTDPVDFRPATTALVIARALYEQHLRQWQSHKLIRLWGNRRVVDALLGNAPLDKVERSWQPELAAFVEHRAPFLLYPECPERP